MKLKEGFGQLFFWDLLPTAQSPKGALLPQVSSEQSPEFTDPAETHAVGDSIPMQAAATSHAKLFVDRGSSVSSHTPSSSQ